LRILIYCIIFSV